MGCIIRRAATSPRERILSTLQHASLRGSVLAAKRAEAASTSLWEEAQAVRNQVPLGLHEPLSAF